MGDTGRMTDTDQLPTQITPGTGLLTAAEFQQLADVPPEVEWFDNLTNPQTRRAYENAVKDFMRFTGIARPEEFRTVTHAQIIALRKELAPRGLGGATIRHRLASLASLFEYRCNRNSVTHNPVKSVERRKTESGEGKTPALGDHQARKLLDAPRKETVACKRDRAILSTLLFHALPREELSKLKVKDACHTRKGVPHLKVFGKGCKVRYLALNPGTQALIHDYLEAAGHGVDENGALFRPAGTIAPASWTPPLLRTGSTVWSAPTRPCSASRSAHTRYGQRPRRTHSTMKPTSPRCRSGWGTLISQRRGSTITGAHCRRTVRHSRFRIKYGNLF